MKYLSRGLSFVILAGVLAVPAFAQKYEVSPYAGGAFLSHYQARPEQIGTFEFKNPGLFGVKAGYFLTSNFELEGNVGYMNQFVFASAFQSPATHAFQYEAVGTYNFSRVGKVFPYVSFGAGAMRLHVSNPSDPQNSDSATFLVIVPPYQGPGAIPFTSRPFTIENGDTFLTLSYGGGLKAPHLWGLVGLQFDLRGRTTPNFYGESVRGFQPSAGILLSLGGER
jgi:hypothetical protein